MLRIDAARMHHDGHQFAVSDNGVWLTAVVPARYITPEPDDGAAAKQPAGPGHEADETASE